MNEERKYVWEVYEQILYIEAKKETLYKANIGRVRSIEEQLARLEKIEQIVDAALEAGVLSRKFFKNYYNDAIEEGKVVVLKFSNGELDISINVHSDTSFDRKGELLASMKKMSTKDIFKHFRKNLEEEHEKQIEIINDLSKYEVVEYTE